MSTIRESFVARFGEDDAAAIEEAAEGHLGGIHDDDDRGDDPFKYLFLGAIGYECVGRFSTHHGIAASPEEMQAWALESGDLGSFRGDPPDFLAMLAGAYEGWIKPSPAPLAIAPST